jgi:hypothetical protein
MREILDRLQHALDEALALPESTPEEALFTRLRALDARVSAAAKDVVHALAQGAAPPSAELLALKDSFEARCGVLWFPLSKMLYGMREHVKDTLERARFAELSPGPGAPCDCAVWRAVANGHGLTAVPHLPGSRVIEDVDDQFETYRVHACGVCGARWLQDFNPDSDPSVTRWWAK